METDNQNKLSPIKQALLAIDKLQLKLREEKSKSNEPIAVIGMACKFPGANNLNEFWDLLITGKSGISKVNDDRWDGDELTSKNGTELGKINTDKGGFIKDYDKFDAQFFGISPREAEKMDPQQRLLMEVSWEAFENAKINVQNLSGTKTGVFIGISTNDYSLIQFDNQNDDYSFIDAYQGSGNASSIAANRLSYFYNFTGPSVSIDTACSSSLVSTHLACQSLRNGDSEIAIAGGVGLILSPHASISFSQAQMLSPKGECKTFDKDADGYVRGEGVGLIVLKKLSDAERDGDDILAIIRASSVNQDGRTNGLTAPNSLSQVEVINDALKKANLSPEQIGYIETHGTGTKLGDPIEVEALSKIMDGITSENPCYLGAVKTNIGHLEAAAGIAGLIKTILVLKNKIIPPNRNFNEINPFIKLDNTRFKIPTAPIDWEGAEKRIAGVSSFGFGGTNSHVILEEATFVDKISNSKNYENNIFTFSAFDEDAIERLAKSYINHIQDLDESQLTNLCYSTALTRADLGYRIAIPFEKKSELIEKLKDISDGNENYAIYKSNDYQIDLNKVAFLFTGQGSQYNNMLKELYEKNNFFTEELDNCFSVADKYCSKSLKHIMFDDTTGLVNETEFTQPILYIIEYVISKFWLRLGVIPDYLLGHSIGEFAAAAISGVFSFEDGMKLTALRGKLMQELPQNGSMVVVFSDSNTVEEYIRKYSSYISIAAINSKNNTVISGLKSKIAELLDQFSQNGIEYKELNVSHAFHSPLMEPILENFRTLANEVKYSAPKIPIVSNLTNEILYNNNIPDAEYWVKHIIDSVKFENGISKLEELNCNVLIEVGPNPVLLGMAKQCIRTNDKLLLSSVSSKKGDWKSLNDSLAKLYVNNIKLNWSEYFSWGNVVKLDLPTYQFKKERHYVDVEGRKNKSLKNFSKGKYKIFVKSTDDKNIVQIVNENEEFVNIDEVELEFLSASEELPFKDNDETVKSDEDTSGLLNDIEFSIEELDKDKQLEEIKRIIKDLLGRILQIKPSLIDSNKSITHLGLDSIMAIELKSSFENNFNVTLPIAELIKGPNINELSLIVQSQLGDKTKVDSIKKVNRESNAFPLSFGQKAMWFQEKMAPDSIFNPTYAVRILSVIDIEKFKYALSVIVERHESLRTTYSYKNGEPIQIIREKVDLPFEYHNCENLSDSELRDLVQKYSNHNFDIENGPVIKTHLFKISNANFVFLISSHHIAVDFWSQAIIVDELTKIYSSSNGQKLPDLKYSYIDYVAWQKEFLNSDDGKTQIEYWQKKLYGELANLDLPTIKPRSATQTFNGNTEKIIIPKTTLEKIKLFCKETNSTQFSFLMTVFNLLLHKYTHQNDIIVGTPAAGRTNSELNNVVGYFVNPIPIRTQINSSQRFIDLQNKVKSSILEGISNQDCPINLIVEKVKPERDVSRPPLFQVMFVYQNAHVLKEEGLSAFAVGSQSANMKLADLNIENYELEENKSAFEITLLAAETNEQIYLTATYNNDLFNQTYIKQLLSNYCELIDSVIDNPDKKIKEIAFNNLGISDLVSDEEISKDLVIGKFEKIVELFPNKVAVQLKNFKLTYGELNIKSNQLANHLLSLKLTTESRIGVFVDRSFEMIIAALGIMKAGLVYVPIDISYPKERVNYIIENANISTVITVEEQYQKLKSINVNCLLYNSAIEELNNQSDQNPSINIDGYNLAYSIYTSGSTGKPKGVLLTHIGLANLVDNQTDLFDISSESKVLQLASFGFDASVSEIFTALTKGATLHLITQEVLLSGNSLLNEINNHKISVATIPPSLLSVIPQDKLESLRTLVSAGETCSPEVVNKWNNGRKFINAYGPTESTVCTTAYLIPKNNISNSIPIGRSIRGFEVYVLDEYLNKVPNYINGELYISGIGLARGYNNSPDLTADKFLPNPFSEKIGTRMYKTGDLVRRLPSGELEFIGRVDDQIKYRGYRIELSEIKIALDNYENIEESVVLFDKKRNKLLGFYKSHDDNNIDLHNLKNYLLKVIPEYMIPSVFIRVDSIPININGKIDRKELLKLSESNERSENIISPTSDIEREIVDVWKSVLKIDEISTNDNFFDLGGHSLNVIQVQEIIKNKYDKEITVVDLFKYPTVKLFANFISDNNDRSKNIEQINNRVNKQKQLLAQRAILRNKK